jgi:hypothetical protein
VGQGTANGGERRSLDDAQHDVKKDTDAGQQHPVPHGGPLRFIGDNALARFLYRTKRLAGGGRSHRRTILRIRFPVIQGKYREFSAIPGVIGPDSSP